MSDEDASGWQDVCPVNRLGDGEAMLAPGCPAIALVKSGGEFFAVDDTCTHGRSSISEGFVEGSTIECVLHGALFDLRTGDALTAPATIPLRTYPVRVEDGRVLVKASGDEG